MGQVAWSPEWQINTKALKFWDARILELRGRQVKYKALYRKAVAARLVHHLQADLDTCLAKEEIEKRCGGGGKSKISRGASRG